MGQLAVAAARAVLVPRDKPGIHRATAREIAGLALRSVTGARARRFQRRIRVALPEPWVHLAAQGVTAEPALAATPGRSLLSPKVHCTRTRSVYRRQLARQAPAPVARLPVAVERNSISITEYVSSRLTMLLPSFLQTPAAGCTW